MITEGELYFRTVNVNSRVITLSSACWQQASKLSALQCFELIWKDWDECAHHYCYYYCYYYNKNYDYDLPVLLWPSVSILSAVTSCIQYTYVRMLGPVDPDRVSLPLFRYSSTLLHSRLKSDQIFLLKTCDEGMSSLHGKWTKCFQMWS